MIIEKLRQEDVLQAVALQQQIVPQAHVFFI